MTIEASQIQEFDESHVLRVPKDMSPELKSRLVAKRDEYGERCRALAKESIYRAPELMKSPKYLTALYKLEVANALVNDGEVDLDRLEVRMIEKTGVFNDELFRKVSEIMYRYLYEDGAGLVGGTGF